MMISSYDKNTTGCITNDDSTSNTLTQPAILVMLSILIAMDNNNNTHNQTTCNANNNAKGLGLGSFPFYLSLPWNTYPL